MKRPTVHDIESYIFSYYMDISVYTRNHITRNLKINEYGYDSIFVNTV